MTLSKKNITGNQWVKRFRSSSFKWIVIFILLIFSLGFIILSTFLLNTNHNIHFKSIPNESRVFQWNKTIGDVMDDRGYDVIQTEDGGFAFTGQFIPYNSSEPIGIEWNLKKMILVKTKENGDIQWNNTYGRNYSQTAAYTLIQCEDKGFALAGYSTPYIHDDAYFVKTDENGTLEWKNFYGSKDEERIYSIVQTTDGGYLLAGFTDSYYFVGDSVYILKLDAIGNEEWYVCYGGTSTFEFECAYSMIETNDGGYAIAGYTSTYGSYPSQLGKEDVWLFKIDNDGQIQWNKTYGYEGIDRAFSLIQTTDGDFVLAGYSARDNTELTEDIYVIKTDSKGIMKWEKIYGGKKADRAYSIIQVADGNLVLTGYTDSNEMMKRDAVIMKINLDGEILWDYSIGGSKDDEMNSIIETNDGDYVLTGYTKSYGEGDCDMWLMRIDSESLNQPPTKLQFRINFISPIILSISLPTVSIKNMKIPKY